MDIAAADRDLTYVILHNCRKSWLKPTARKEQEPGTRATSNITIAALIRSVSHHQARGASCSTVTQRLRPPQSVHSPSRHPTYFKLPPLLLPQDPAPVDIKPSIIEEISPLTAGFVSGSEGRIQLVCAPAH
jgi:hypothetical protein